MKSDPRFTDDQEEKIDKYMSMDYIEVKVSDFVKVEKTFLTTRNI